MAAVLSLLFALTVLAPASAVVTTPSAWNPADSDWEWPAIEQGSDRGRDAVPDGPALRDPSAPDPAIFATPLDPGLRVPGCVLSEFPFDPADTSIDLDLVPYHDIAPRLCAAAEGSDRLTLSVAGESVQGREIPLAVVTSPETPEETAAIDALQRLMVEDPAEARELLDDGGFDDYKPSILVNGNIHGDEWEGADIVLDLVDFLTTADRDVPTLENLAGFDDEAIEGLPTVGELLDSYRVVVVPTVNPDGRVAGTRANANGLDLNRDFITQSQPETQIVRDILIEHQPLMFQDHHGYVSGQPGGFYTGYGLIEPTTPPHGSAYEYDLYLPTAFFVAEQSEALIQVRAEDPDGGLPLITSPEWGVTIPFRDIEEGWDDWPPIFTPMYSIYHGIVGATIEVPFRPTPSSSPQVSATNIEYGRSTIDAMAAVAIDEAEQLLSDQLEVYERGAAGEPSPYDTIPEDFVPGFNDDNRWPTEYPRGYVLPLGDGQASDAAATRLAGFLIDNGVRVEALTDDTTIDGTEYAAGSYVVDMHQAKRGMAQVILSDGEDISERIDAMYDISGWSLGRLWGATVDAVEDDAFTGSTERLDVPHPGGIAEGAALGYGFTVTSTSEAALLGDLLAAGIELQRADGVVLVPAGDRDLLAALAEDNGVFVERVTELPDDRTDLSTFRIAATGLGAWQRDLLVERLGLPITSASSVSTDDYEVVLAVDAVTPAGFAQFLQDGGGVVAAGASTALHFIPSLISGSSVTGGGIGTNGVLAVDRSGGDVLPGRDGPGASFTHGGGRFTATGDADVIQALDADTPVISGFWPTGPDAGGDALVIADELADGGRAVGFANEPLFRQHPEGLIAEVVDALLWAADLPATEADLGDPYEPGDDDDDDDAGDDDAGDDDAGDDDAGDDDAGDDDAGDGDGDGDGDDDAGDDDAGDGGDGDTGDGDAGDATPIDLPARISGPSRIETAVEISRTVHEPGVSQVTIATAGEFADALAAGPVAGRAAGPVLLVWPDHVPDVVRDEILRLAPEEIVVAGGVEAVSEVAAAALGELAPVTRISGTDRFATAAALSAADGRTGGTVFITTGLDFPDALAGGVWGTLEDAPLLLVAPTGVTGFTSAELERRQPDRVVILGGTEAVAPDVAEQLGNITGVEPERVSGSDRFETAGLIAAQLGGVSSVWAATGLDFADALAAAPAAAVTDGAILLVVADAVPAVTQATLDGLAPDQVTAVGGTAVISDEVLIQLQ